MNTIKPCCLHLELDQDRNLPVFYFLVISAPFQASIPPFFFSFFFLNSLFFFLFFFFLKLRTAWHGVREWGRRAGEKVMAYTIASHTTFKCFSLRHSGNWARAGLDNVSLCVSCSLHCGKLNCGAIIALCCAFVSDSFLRKTQQGNTSTGPAAFSLAGKQG